MTIQHIKVRILPILKKEGVEKAAIFGSFARGTNKAKSDIDLLVKLKKNKSLLDLVGLKIELEQKLGRKVDVITYNSLNPHLRKIILDEQKIIYEKS
ncbi:hypothetical protein A2483_02320 [Candidatus Peregrinibacteria bacterium RIFOXYC2_FULL_33_13]|nr:MAG: Nucleotidyltransferase [Candidatus Peregrinibacteria bacterium GW2011_GWA2_33_10]KKP41014.1 MAG: polymerase beta domain-containing protein [Candidatus Peregrinibacteria bacterium GW2011_GWC2_33_13]OGJ46802.1 MAG: hypothetical protein A2229_01595 [Candidatus Peregrinibacteria bacterium RIFOXYA2_FULL_33_7]OGJ54254.1 MAG: hypothetical protein A2483_02320 [Candidatus Peregrinibacteria bacterium RIFOXYC2_FULL_33_13]